MNTSKLTTIFIGILLLIAIGFVLSILKTILIPFVLAVFISYILKPIVLFLKTKKVPMFISLLIILILFAAVLIGISMIVSSNVQSFIIEMPRYQERLETILGSFMQTFVELSHKIGITPGDLNWKDSIQIGSVTNFITTGLESLFSIMSNIFLILLFVIFILSGTGHLAEKTDHMFIEDHSNRIASIITNIDEKVRQYLLTKTLLSFIASVLTTILLAILGVNFAFFFGFLTFLLNFIPNLGAIIASLLPFLISLVQFETLSQPLLVLILLIVMHNIIGNILEPKLLSSSLNLSPLLILVALVFWGWLWGAWGMILAIPIISTIKIIFENINDLKPIAVLMSDRVLEK